MEKLLNLYDKFLELQSLKKVSTEYTYNRYFIDLLHLASDLNHAQLSAKRPAVKELCRLAWEQIESERRRIKPLCENRIIKQQ